MKKLTFAILTILSLSSFSQDDLQQREDIEMMYYYEVNSMRARAGVSQIPMASAFQSDAISATALCYEAWFDLEYIDQSAIDYAWVLVDGSGSLNSGGDVASADLLFFYNDQDIRRVIRKTIRDNYGHILGSDIKSMSVYIAEDSNGHLYGAAIGYR